jgi:hypothetical protein
MHQTDEMYDAGRMEVRLLKNRRGAKMTGSGRKANLIWKPATMEFRYDDGAETSSQSFIRAA